MFYKCIAARINNLANAHFWIAQQTKHSDILFWMPAVRNKNCISNEQNVRRTWKVVVKTSRDDEKRAVNSETTVIPKRRCYAKRVSWSYNNCLGSLFSEKQKRKFTRNGHSRCMTLYCFRGKNASRVKKQSFCSVNTIFVPAKFHHRTIIEHSPLDLRLISSA